MSRTTAYTALSSAQYDDVVPIVDVHDTSMAATGTTKKITVRNLRGLSLIYLNDYGADPTGATLSDSAWTAAYAAATAQIAAWSGDTGLTAGAVIVLGTGIYKFSFATVAITDMRIGLVGQGAALTRITSTSVTSGALVRVSYSGTEPAGSPSAPVGGFTVWGWDAFGSNQVGFHADGGRTHCRVADIYAQGFVSTGGIAFKFTPLGGAGWEGASFLGLDAQNSNIAFMFDGANGGSNNGTMDYTSWNIHSVAANTVIKAVNGVHFYGASMTLHGNIGGGAGTSGANTFGVIGASSSDTARFQNCQLFLQHEVDAGSSSVTDFTITGTSSAGIIDCYGLIGFVNAGGTMLAGSLGGSSVFKFQGLVEVCPLATAMAGTKYQLGGQYTAVDSTGTVANVTGNIKVTGYVTASNLPIVPSGDTSGVTDAANITAAIAALPAQGGRVTLAPTAQWYIKCGNLSISRSGVYLNAPGCYINAVGTGDVIRMYDNTNNWVANGAYGGGVLGYPVIDGTSAGAGSAGVHAGDLFQSHWEVNVQNFTGSGSIGVHFDNAHFWTEQLRARIFANNCTQHVVFDVTGATTSTASFGRADIQVYINQVTASNDGVVLQNGAVLYDGELAVRGNFVGSGSALTSCAVRVTGTVPGSHPGAGNFARIADCRLDWGLECASGANTPKTIIFGSNSNLIQNCYGIMDFGGDESGANFTATARIGNVVPFTGPIKGDSVLTFGAQGLAPAGSTWSATGGFAVGDFSAATVITTGQTISTGKAMTRVSEAGNVTGMILGAGSFDGQTFWLVNESNFTITFAASGTSHVADGTSDVVPALCARMYIFEGNDTNLWYRVA